MKTKGLAPIIVAGFVVMLSTIVYMQFLIGTATTTYRSSENIGVIRTIDSAESIRNFMELSMNYSVMQGSSGTAELGGKIPGSSEEDPFYWYDTKLSTPIAYPSEEEFRSSATESIKNIIREYMESGRSKGLKRIFIPNPLLVSIEIPASAQSFSAEIRMDGKPKYENPIVATELNDVWEYDFNIRIFDQFRRGKNFIDQDVAAPGALHDKVEQCISSYATSGSASQFVCPGNIGSCVPPSWEQAFTNANGVTPDQAKQAIRECAEEKVLEAQASAIIRDGSANYSWTTQIRINEPKITPECTFSCTEGTCGGGTFEENPRGWQDGAFVNPAQINAWDFTGWNSCSNMDHGWSGVNRFCQNLGYDGALSNDQNPCFYQDNTSTRYHWDPFANSPSAINEPVSDSGRVVSQVKCYNEPDPAYTASTSCTFSYEETLEFAANNVDLNTVLPTYSYVLKETSKRNIVLGFLNYIRVSRP